MPLRPKTRWRPRVGPSPARRLTWTVLAASSSAVLLSACGATHTVVGARAAQKTSRSASTGGGSEETSSGENGSCHTVARPQPRGPQHIAKPTLRLDPARRYTVTLQTNCGAIEIRLAVKEAPKIAASFVYLLKMGFYNDLTFHRVVEGFVIQGGDPNGDGSGGPGYTVVERPPAQLQYKRGVVAMAKTETQPAGAAGSQFFIVVGENAELPPAYALLGRVVGGWSTVSAIAHVQTVAGPDGERSSPASPIVISRAQLHVS